MASWIVFALLSPFFFALVATVDKFLIDKRIRSPFAFAVASGAALGLYAIILLLAYPLETMETRALLPAVGGGLLFAAAVVVYLAALQKEEVSRVIPLLYLLAVVAAVLETLLLGASFSGHFYLATLAMIAGAFLISVKDLGKLSFSPAAWLVVLAAVLFGAQAVVEKWALRSLSYWNVFSVQFITYGLVLSLLLLGKGTRQVFSDIIRNRTILLVMGNESISLLAIMTHLVAASLTQVSYVAALGAIEPLYILLIATGVSVVAPTVLNESHTTGQLLQKGLATALIVGGGAVIALGA